jgi:hypothetical protein
MLHRPIASITSLRFSSLGEFLLSLGKVRRIGASLRLLTASCFFLFFFFFFFFF